jgi:uncharacterized protein YbaR (Trm112 family)
MDDCNTAHSMSDLEILLRDMVYVRKLNDDQVLERLPQFKSETLRTYVRRCLAYVRDYPLCSKCNVRLWHKSIEYGVPEALYCPECGQAFEIESPNKPLPELGGDV